MSLLMVDLSSNTASARQAIVEAIRPVVTEAVEEGGAIRFVVSGGSGERIRVSDCLDGGVVLHTDFNNPTREEGEQEKAIAAIEGNVAELLLTMRVAPRGDVTNLISQIPDQLAVLEHTAAASAARRPIDVDLFSDLDSRTVESDCMSLDGVPASVVNADKLVARCIKYHYYQPLPPDTALRVVRPQLTPGDSTASRMSGFLADSLCAQLTEGGATCLGGA